MKYSVKEVKIKLVIFTFCCAGYGGVAGLHVMSVLYHAPFASNVTNIFAIYYGVWRGGKGGKLEKNFTLVFHLKSDWKWNLLFRSSSCASSLSQVEKKTKK